MIDPGISVPDPKSVLIRAEFVAGVSIRKQIGPGFSRSREPQFTHFRDEGRALEPELLCRPVRPSDYPICFPDDLQNILRFRLCQRSWPCLMALFRPDEAV